MTKRVNFRLDKFALLDDAMRERDGEAVIIGRNVSYSTLSTESCLIVLFKELGWPFLTFLVRKEEKQTTLKHSLYVLFGYE